MKYLDGILWPGTITPGWVKCNGYWAFMYGNKVTFMKGFRLGNRYI